MTKAEQYRKAKRHVLKLRLKIAVCNTWIVNGRDAPRFSMVIDPEGRRPSECVALFQAEIQQLLHQFPRLRAELGGNTDRSADRSLKWS